MPKLENKPLPWFKTNPQVRTQFDDANLRPLGESLRVKQLQPVLCQPDGTIIAGERRYRAALLVGLESLEVKIADEPLTEVQVKLWQLTENMQRADLTGGEQWSACAELMCMNPAWQMKDLAAHLHLDPSTVTRILSPSKCIEAVQDALRDGKIGISDAYCISKQPHSAQAGLLALKLSGASRDAIEQAGRKSRAGDKPTIRLSRVRVQLPGKVSIVLTGADLSLEEVAQALTAAQQEVRRARDQGIDVKAFNAVMSSKAKAG